MSKIKIGDQIPKFSLEDQHGNMVSIETYLGKPLVIYFYPKDDTPGCIREACYFRDQFEVFAEHGAEIIGISTDSPKSHLKFAKKYKLNFTLLSDKSREVEKLFGVKRSVLGLLPGRVTFVFDKEGIVRHVFNSQFKAEQHVEEALQIIKQF
ncbi:MAG: peroxiredoxin [Cyclobacteriaceae bacterium]